MDRDDNMASGAQSPGERDEPDSPAERAGGTAAEENLWSPPQFSLRMLFLATTAVAVLCALAKVTGIHFLAWVSFALLGWLLVGVSRLVRPAGSTPDDE